MHYLNAVGVLFAVFSPVSIFCENESCIVNTKQGQVEGYLSPNGLYYEFAGIKYAEPIKFRAPKDPPSFPGVFKADSRCVVCPQFLSNDLFGAPSDTEDCLVLNIFTPKSFLSNTTLPIMVYLHGGDFGVGSGAPCFYGPQYLCCHEVVVVTLNYRLNVYGFLNLCSEDAPGNAGLKDIRAALRWIKDNIAGFGGNPDNVTVFGQGSGGIAALYLMFSKSTKGLCNKIISQSGTMFCPQSFDPKPLLTASQVAKSLGVKSKNPYELYELYSQAPIYEVEEAISKQINSKFVFVPSVEEEFADEEPFLTDTPFNILNTASECFNPVPLLIGINTVEGLISALDYYTITGQADRIIHEDLTALDQRSLVIPKNDKDLFREEIYEAYFTNGTEEESVIGGIINLNSDFSFVGPMSLFTEMFSNKTNEPIYQYIFNYIGNRNLGRLLTNTSLEATTNLDELIYLFELDRFPLPMDENDARIVTFMTMMWTNFAKYGTPIPDPSNGEWLTYPDILAISLDPQYVAPLTPDRAQFWKDYYLSHGAEIKRVKNKP